MVDTDGHALVLQAHPAGIQDRDGAIPLLKASRKSLPFVEIAFADSAYGAQRVKDATCVSICCCPPDMEPAACPRLSASSGKVEYAKSIPSFIFGTAK